jgi:hypothetical protein
MVGMIGALDAVTSSYRLLTRQNLFCTNCLIPRFDLGLVVQNHVQQGIMDFQSSVVFDKAQFAELVHEKAHPRSGRADHLRQRFLTEVPTIGSGLPSLPELSVNTRYYKQFQFPDEELACTTVSERSSENRTRGGV